VNCSAADSTIPRTKNFIVFFDFNKSNRTADAFAILQDAVKTAKSGWGWATDQDLTVQARKVRDVNGGNASRRTASRSSGAVKIDLRHRR
jgi:hypothetical protein